RRRVRVLEHAVVGHGGHDAVDVVATEGIEKPPGGTQSRGALEVGVRSVAHGVDGEAWWIRTTDSPLKRRMLYQAGLPPRGAILHSRRGPVKLTATPVAGRVPLDDSGHQDGPRAGA